MNLKSSCEIIKVDGSNERTIMNFSNTSETVLDINSFIKDHFNELIS